MYHTLFFHYCIITSQSCTKPGNDGSSHPSLDQPVEHPFKHDSEILKYLNPNFTIVNSLEIKTFSFICIEVQ